MCEYVEPAAWVADAQVLLAMQSPLPYPPHHDVAAATASAAGGQTPAVTLWLIVPSQTPLDGVAGVDRRNVRSARLVDELHPALADVDHVLGRREHGRAERNPEGGGPEDRGPPPESRAFAWLAWKPPRETALRAGRGERRRGLDGDECRSLGLSLVNTAPVSESVTDQMDRDVGQARREHPVGAVVPHPFRHLDDHFDVGRVEEPAPPESPVNPTPLPAPVARRASPIRRSPRTGRRSGRADWGCTTQGTLPPLEAVMALVAVLLPAAFVAVRDTLLRSRPRGTRASDSARSTCWTCRRPGRRSSRARRSASRWTCRRN